MATGENLSEGHIRVLCNLSINLKIFKLKQPIKLIWIEMSTSSSLQARWSYSWPDCVEIHIKWQTRVNVWPWHFIGGMSFKQNLDANLIYFHHELIASYLGLYSGRIAMILLSLTFKCLSFPTVNHNLEEIFLSHMFSLLTVWFCHSTWSRLHPDGEVIFTVGREST